MVRQPFAGVDFIPQAGTVNLAAGDRGERGVEFHPVGGIYPYLISTV
jgi:hypothetical protein